MNFYDILFYTASAGLISAAGYAVLTENRSSSLKAFVISLLLGGIILLLLRADFIVFMYLFVFTSGLAGVVIFSFINSSQADSPVKISSSTLSLIAASAFLAIAAGNIFSTKWKEVPPENAAPGFWEILRLMQSEYFLPFLAIAMLLFIGIIGTNYITRKN